MELDEAKPDELHSVFVFQSAIDSFIKEREQFCWKLKEEAM